MHGTADALKRMRTLAFLVMIGAVTVGGQNLSLSLSGDGSFSILRDGSEYLRGSEVQVAGLSAKKGTLNPVGERTTTSGSDEFGSYVQATFKWAATGSSDVLMLTSFRTYPADTTMIVFEQEFVKALGPDPASTSSARTIFPSFDRATGPADHLDCFAYHGVFPGIKPCTVGSYAESHQGGAPLVMYDSSESSLPMAVFSPLSSPKAQHMAHGASWFGAGIKATVSLIPAGWKQSFLLTAADGINDGMMAWGDRMLKFTGKARADMYLDATHSTIGFWTDNGGYYHYATGNKTYGRTYEEVLPRVKAYHDSIGVPFGHWQFDSWFYPKDGGVNPGGGGGAVTNWTADPKIFPSGMAAIQRQLGVPIVMHNRQWSVHSDYIQHEPFRWYKDVKAAVPEDPHAFFGWFFQQQEGWGLSMYEQDWMCTEYDDVGALQTNISLADLWLEGMADGAAASGRTVQYCMPYAHDVLASARHAAVTNIRATGDYFHSDNQWAIGGTAMLYWALGKLPFKDGFYSSTNKQIGGQTVGPETNPDREALMATLSCAMVGPMDGIGLLNASRVMTSCRKDGLILKPDRPVMTSDVCFLAADPACHTYHTFTDILFTNATAKISRAHYIFSDDGHAPITAQMLYHPTAPLSKYLYYNWYSGRVGKFEADNAFEPGYEGHTYVVVVPLLSNGWALLGDVDKYVPLARKRVKSASVEGSGLRVTVAGVAGETVTICALRCPLGCPAGTTHVQLVCDKLSFVADGTQLHEFVQAP